MTAPPRLSRLEPTGRQSDPNWSRPAAVPTRTPRTCWAGISAPTGFQIVLSVEIATVVEKYLGDDIRNFLADHGLTTADISRWVLHAAGPKVIDAVENVLDVPKDAFDITRKSLRNNGNLSSVSVLDILQDTMTDPPPPGSLGLMIAMGPGFSAELVLLSW